MLKQLLVNINMNSYERLKTDEYVASTIESFMYEVNEENIDQILGKIKQWMQNYLSQPHTQSQTK